MSNKTSALGKSLDLARSVVSNPLLSADFILCNYCVTECFISSWSFLCSYMPQVGMQNKVKERLESLSSKS